MRTFSKITPFLLAVRQAIVQAAIVPSNCCQIALTDKYLVYPQGQYLIMITPQGMQSRGYEAGGGLEDTVIDGKLNFRIVSQNILDVATADIIALTDNEEWNINTGNAQGSTVGLYVILDELMGAVQMFDACYTDFRGAVQSYLIEPMRFTNISPPVRDVTHDQYVYIELQTSFAICQDFGV